MLPERASRRLVFAAAGAGLVVAAFALAGPGAWQMWAFGAGPDVALLFGAAPGREKGRLHPRAVPLYNALHLPVGPAVLAIAAVWLGDAWLAGALAWGAHVALDRAAGYGLRTQAGFQRGA